MAISESERIQRKSEWFDDEGLKLETSALETLYGSQLTLSIAGSAALSTYSLRVASFIRCCELWKKDIKCCFTSSLVKAVFFFNRLISK